MDLATLEWSGECAGKLGVNIELLPKIRSNAEVLGTVKSGPMAGVPIAGCLGDQQAALLGASALSTLHDRLDLWDWLARLLHESLHLSVLSSHTTYDAHLQEHCTL